MVFVPCVTDLGGAAANSNDRILPQCHNECGTELSRRSSFKASLRTQK
jgi:hypothetical protein